MNISKALKLMQIDNIMNETALKKQFRKLMRENHPDSGGSHEIATELNKAYEFLLEAHKNSKTSEEAHDNFMNQVFKEKTREKSINISIQALDKLFEGKALRDKNGKEVVSRENLGNVRLLVNGDITVKVTSNGEEKVFTHKGIALYNSSALAGEPNIIYKFRVEDGFDNDVHIEISLNGKTTKGNIRQKNVNIKFNYVRYLVNIQIERG